MLERGRAQRHRRVRVDPRLHGRGEDGDVAQGRGARRVHARGRWRRSSGSRPAQDPRFATIVVLDEPANQYGSVASAPVFSEIVQAALTQYRVPPDDTAAPKQYDAARAYAQHAGQQLLGAARRSLEPGARTARPRRRRPRPRPRRPPRTAPRRAADHRRGRDARYCRRRPVPEPVGGRVRCTTSSTELDVLGRSR